MARVDTSHSVIADVEFRQAAKMPPPEPPAGVPLDTAGRSFWDAAIQARDYRDWTPIELLMLARAAQLEDEIQDHLFTLDLDGRTYEMPNGTKASHPAVSQLNSARRSQLSLIGKLHLTAMEPPTVASRAKKAQAARDSAEENDLEDGLD